MAQRFSLYEDLTVEENIDFSAQCAHGLSAREARHAAAEALARLGLAGLRRERTGHLSHGWKQRVARSRRRCVTGRAVLLLDEATAGIDLLARQELWGVLAECARAGAAVLLSTHYLDEAERCHHIGYLREGRLVACGTPPALQGRAHTLLEAPDAADSGGEPLS